VKAIRNAFSLTELLVVVSVILVLLTILIVGANLVFSESMRVKCQHNLEQIGYALRVYSSANLGMYPKAWDMHSQRRWYDTLLATYLPDKNVIGCPQEPEPPLTPARTGEYHVAEEVENALDWLKRAQEQGSNKGYWDTQRWGGSPNNPNVEHGGYPLTSDQTKAGHHVGVTAMGLMAFLGNGCSDRYPVKYAETVSSAIDYLLRRQQGNGKFMGYWHHNSGTAERWYQYDHNVATMAMSLAYMMTGRSDCRESALKGLAHLELMREDRGGYGWGYDLKFNDISLSGWGIQALHAGQQAGLFAPDTNGVNQCLRYMVKTGGGGTYMSYYRFGPTWNDNRGGYRSYIATTVSLLARLLMGHRPGPSANTTTNEGRCRGVLNWLRNGSDYHTYANDIGGRQSLYFYYYMSLCNSLLGDSGWDRWCDRYFPEKLLAEQETSGSNAGSWPPEICYWGFHGGRAYTTAMAAMTLQAGEPGHWDPGQAMGKCSYGYNSLVGDSRRTPAANTILVMDYEAYIICRGYRNEQGEFDPTLNDEDYFIALRHDGKANALFADGHVEALAIDDIKPGMWTLESAD
jgi:prepilin-type processing-associated H-X9-DG protein/prepilin-type N-terminal cleavage/methylation domain-containing protein